MNTNRVLLLPLLIISLDTSAQDAQNADTSKWKIDGYGSATFNQVSFTNWAAGGDNSISFALVGLLNTRYAINRHHWNNTVNLLFGLIRTDEFGLRKNEDKLEMESKYGFDFNKKRTLALSFLANFRSQFANGYNYPNDSVVISKLAAPGYLTLALGIDWKPLDYFSLFISPATGRILFIRDQNIANVGTYGNEAGVPVLDSQGNIIGYNPEGEKNRFDFGALLSAKLNKEVVKNVTIISKLDLFSNYTGETSESRMADVNWETAFLFKVNEWLSASLTLSLIYDKEIMIPAKDDPADLDDRVQFKEALGIGLTCKFDNQKTVK
ncbi:MAG TPA: DUF3078 domain-containing protein [Chitinophagales bacterium]|nr:DUF3078 domain-containing protein [Chitinophagales bacterium]